VPKAKTHSGAKKRFAKTGTGKVKRFKAAKSHLLTHKTRTRKRNLRQSVTVDKANEKQIKKLIPFK